MDCEGLGSMEGFFHRQGVEADYVALHAGEKIPGDAGRYNGVVILGGPMNVYQEKEYPFLVEEDRFIKKSLAELKPLLGICLGSQLIAKAAGAKVLTGHRKELGWYDVSLTGAGRDDLLFKGFPKEFKVFQWHGDTFNIPSGAEKLACSEIFPNQAYRLGNAYALQFHIEVTDSIIAQWMKEYSGEMNSLDYIDAKQIEKDTKKYSKGLYKLADKFYGNFLKILAHE